MNVPTLFQKYRSVFQKKTILSFLKRCMSIFKGKYGVILFVFLITLWYNLVVVPTDELGKNDAVKVSQDEFFEIKADLSGSVPEKIYPDILDSVEGDWYRLGIEAKALDSDEEVDVVALSAWGEEKTIGTLTLDRSGKEAFQEYVFQLDDYYRDIIVRKKGETQEDRWRGGKVIITELFATRLQITDVSQIKTLRPTLLRKSRVAQVFVDTNTDRDIFFSGKSDYLYWGTFESPGDVLYSVSIPAERGDIFSDERYAIDFFGYDKESKVVDKKLLHGASFPESDIDKYMKKTGMADIPVPLSLESGKSYAIGIRYRDAAKPGTLEFSRVADDNGKEGFVVVQIRHAFLEEEKNLLLPGAKIEDIGNYLRYEYRSFEAIADYANIFESSKSVVFRQKESRVLGDCLNGEYFTYAISTIDPFSEMTLRADQYGTYEDQIALDYSLDNKNWMEIPFSQLKDKSQRFSYTIISEKIDTHLIYLRVRYIGKEDDPKRKFGLDRLRITAKIPKK